MALGKSDREERVKIIDELDKNLLVSASAGSGKTTILVERMVALVESGRVNLSKMAALTFTKKAADEFYDRFYKKLQKRVKDGFDKANDDKYSLLENPTPEAVIRDKEALKAIDTCFFGTIDAFYQKILNEHPLEAGLSSSARIIDEDEFNTYLIHKFNEFLNSDDPNISKGAEFFAEHIGATNFSSLMTIVLNNAELDLYKINEDPDKLLEYYKVILPEVKKLCNVLVDNEDALRMRKYDKKTNEWIDSTNNSRDAWDALLQQNNLIQKLKDDDIKSALKTLKKIKDIRIKQDDIKLLEKINKLDFLIEEVTPKNGSAYCILRSGVLDILNKIVHIRVVGFVDLVKPIIREALSNDGLLTFSEATICLLNLLKDEDSNKEVIEQIRSKIDCLLIDECQDTDIKQYEIFFRLTANDFNKDFDRLTIDGGKLYACGDRKQGIYHFRGADVSTYDRIKDIFLEKKENGLPFDLVTLTDNFRSKGNMIRYFNKTFETMLASQGYSPVLNDDVKQGEEHFGAFSYFTDANHDPEKVADLILRLKKEKNCNYKDFMIITSNKSSINDYAKEFSKRGIPCYSEGNIDINVSALSNVVINIFKYVASNKTDTISYVEILTSPLFGFDPKKTIDMNRDFLAEINLSLEKTIWPSDLLEQIAANRVILKALNCKGIDVLIGFIHLLKEAENTGSISSYSDAIQYFKDLQNDEKKIERLSLLANSINAVQIANAHKTKGLEKMIVIVTKAGDNNNPGDTVKTNDKLYINSFSGNFRSKLLENPNATNDEIAPLVEGEKEYGKGENKRLLYVVATRAREYLYLPRWEDKKGKIKKGKWSDLYSDFVTEINENLALTYDVLQSKIVLNDSIDKGKIVSKENSISSYKMVAPSQIQSASKFSEEYEISELERNDALEFGTMVHKLLENIVKAKNYELDSSMSKYIVEQYDRLDLFNKLEEVRKTIYSGGYKQTDCPFNDLIKKIKTAKCYTEVPFSYKDNDSYVNGFIDLVIEKDDETIIIDYKTDSNEIDHSGQLSLYEKALKSTDEYKDKKISSFIYHIYK